MNRRAPLLAGVASLAIVGLAVFFLVMPKLATIRSTQDQLTQQQQQEALLRVELAHLQEAKTQAAHTKQQIRNVENQVPPTADLPGLIRLLRGAADSAAVDLFQFSPGAPTVDTSGEFSIISTSVNVSGSYFSLDEFLFRLESLPRAAKVTNVTISPNGATVTTTSTATPAPSASPAAVTLSGGELSMALTVDFFTSDLSAGPGSAPGPTDTVTSTGS